MRVHVADPALPVHREHPFDDTAQDGLRLCLPALELRRQAQEPAPHLVHRFGEGPDLSGGSSGDGREQVAASDARGSLRELFQRLHEPASQKVAEPGGQAADDDGEEQEDAIEAPQGRTELRRRQPRFDDTHDVTRGRPERRDGHVGPCGVQALGDRGLGIEHPRAQAEERRLQQGGGVLPQGPIPLSNPYREADLRLDRTRDRVVEVQGRHRVRAGLRCDLERSARDERARSRGDQEERRGHSGGGGPRDHRAGLPGDPSGTNDAAAGDRLRRTETLEESFEAGSVSGVERPSQLRSLGEQACRAAERLRGALHDPRGRGAGQTDPSPALLIRELPEQPRGRGRHTQHRGDDQPDVSSQEDGSQGRPSHGLIVPGANELTTIPSARPARPPT